MSFQRGNQLFLLRKKGNVPLGNGSGNCPCGQPCAPNSSLCNPCYYIRYKQIYPEKILDWKLRSRARYLLKTYNITLDEYDRMLATQNGCCAICGIDNNGKTHDGKYDLPFVVDHNHETGENRGLLCNACNFLVGLIEANERRYEQVKVYLLKYGKLIQELARSASQSG